MGFAAAFVAVTFYRLYETSRQSIINEWENDTVRAASDVGLYLSSPENAIAFSALNLDDLLKSNASAGEAKAYLAEQSEFLSTMVEGNYNGVHAYYRGEYIDAGEWQPGADYDATSFVDIE